MLTHHESRRGHVRRRSWKEAPGWDGVVVLALALVSMAALGGCQKPRAAQGNGRSAGLGEVETPKTHAAASSTMGPARVVYNPGGSPGEGALEAVAVQPGTGHTFVFLIEWVRKDEEGRPRRSRLTRLDLADGKAQVIRDLGEERPNNYRDLVCARSGRIALGDNRYRGDEVEYRIEIWDPDGRWQPLNEWSEHRQDPWAWSPDSRSLLYTSLFYDQEYPFVWTVATQTSPTGTFHCETLNRDSLPLRQAMWGADKSLLFALALSPPSIYDATLLSISWPSGKTKSLLTGRLGSLDVADQTGTAAVSMADGQHWGIWRVQRGGDPERTPILLSEYPKESRASPNGRYVAVVLSGNMTGKFANEPVGDGGLAVYDAVDGAEYRVPDTVGKRVAMVHWVLDGKALIFTIIPKGGDPEDFNALGHQLWLVRMPWAGRPGRAGN